MTRMFQGASSFNQDISGWNVSNVVIMTKMFLKASVFNQDLSSWNVSKVTNCKDFEKNTNNWTSAKPNFTNCEY